MVPGNITPGRRNCRNHTAKHVATVPTGHLEGSMRSPPPAYAALRGPTVPKLEPDCHVTINRRPVKPQSVLLPDARSPHCRPQPPSSSSETWFGNFFPNCGNNLGNFSNARD